MDNAKECMHCHGQECVKCRRHYLLRWIIGIAILAFVFWMGVKVGEFKEMVYGEYGYNFPGRYMMYGNYQGLNNAYYGYGPGMMRGFWQGQATSTAK